MHRPSDEAGPAGLMARAETGAIVAMEVFVELQAIAPVRVLLEFCGPAEDGSTPVLAPQEDCR